VTPSSGDAEVVTVSGALTFSAADWNTAQTVTLTGVEDADAVDDTATVSHAVSGADYGDVTVAQLEVTVTDRAGVAVEPQSLVVTEGSDETYTVVLTGAPTEPVIITPGSDNPDVTLIGGALTFTTGNWNTRQTVTVTAGDDPDSQDERAEVSHAVSGYGSISSAASVSVTVRDNDVGATIDSMASRVGRGLAPTELSVGEGESETYTVVLQVVPDADVTVTPRVAGPPGHDLSLQPNGALTFTLENWNVLQTVTVTAAQDDDAADDTATLSHTLVSASGNYEDAPPPADVNVTVTDDDTPGVSISVAALTIDEGGTGAYTVVLDTRPAGGDVTVTPDSSDPGVASVSGALTFDSGNWSTAQTVTLTGVDDGNVADGTAAVAHAVRGADYDLVTAAGVEVTVTDDDEVGVRISDAGLTIDEGGTGTYTVVLDSEPAGGEVTVTPSGGDNGVATVSGALTFTDANWNTHQTVTLTGTEDDDAAAGTVTVTHAVAGADYDSVNARDVEVTVTDDDEVGVRISDASLTIDEGTDTGIYTVALASAPVGGAVTVTPGSGDADVATVSGALTFTADNWSTHQTVTLTGIEDADTQDDTATVSHAVAGAGTDYEAVTAAEVEVTVTDRVGITVEPQLLVVTEGDNGTYTVVLSGAPTGNVVITLSSDNADVTLSGALTTVTPSVAGLQGHDLTLEPGDALTFTSANWNAAQTVTVTAGQDDDAANDTATLSHALVSASGNYQAAEPPADVEVTVTDNDSAGVTIEPLAATIGEGVTDTQTYTVVLTSQPAGGDVTVTPESSDSNVATASGSLTFTDTNWSTRQTVTVTGVEDDNAVADTATVSHQVAGADYGNVTAADVVVTVTDNDTAAVVISEATLTVGEGDTGI